MALVFINNDQMTQTLPQGIELTAGCLTVAPGVEATCVNQNQQITDIILSPGARLTYYQLLSASQKLKVTQQKDSYYHGQLHTLTGSIDCEFESCLAEPGAECELYGLMLGCAANKINYKTVLNHLAPHCRSREYFKSIVTDTAHVIFNGLVKVAIGADKTDSNQQNKNLLLSKTAKAETKPELAIYADDVKAAHGATVGQLDDEALYYLQSRGLSASQARELLIQAFAAEILEKIQFAPLKANLIAALKAMNHASI